MAQTDPTDTGQTRRSVLTLSGVTLATSGLGLGLAPVAEARQGTTTAGDELIDAVLLETPDKFERSNLPGLYIHLGPELEPTDAQVSDRCAVADWPPERTVAYEISLVDPQASGNPGIVSTLYVRQEIEIGPGDLFIIRDLNRCAGGYVGVEIERIGEDVDSRSRRQTQPIDPSDIPTPGKTPGYYDISIPSVIPSPGRWQQENLPGFFAHVGRSVDPVEAQVSDQCLYADWPPERTVAYDVTIINNFAAGNEAIQTTLYVPDSIEVTQIDTREDDQTAAAQSGALFVINTVHRCESGYVGVELERVGITEFNPGPVTPGGGTEFSSNDSIFDDLSTGDGPGFDPVAAIAGLLGAGLLAQRYNRDE